MFVNEGPAGILLCWVERVYFSDLGDEGVLEFDGVIEGSMRGKGVISLLREDIGEG